MLMTRCTPPLSQAVAALVQFCGHCLAQHDPTIPCLEGTPWQWFFGIEGLCCYKDMGTTVQRLTSVDTGDTGDDDDGAELLEMEKRSRCVILHVGPPRNHVNVSRGHQSERSTSQWLFGHIVAPRIPCYFFHVEMLLF